MTLHQFAAVPYLLPSLSHCWEPPLFQDSCSLPASNPGSHILSSGHLTLVHLPWVLQGCPALCLASFSFLTFPLAVIKPASNNECMCWWGRGRERDEGRELARGKAHQAPGRLKGSLGREVVVDLTQLLHNNHILRNPILPSDFTEVG